MLIAWYKLNGDLLDSSGNGNHGVPTGTPTYAEGIVGKAMVCTGGQPRVDVPTDKIKDLSESIAMNETALKELLTNTEFYGYYSDYDWVVFCWLFGRMIDLPEGFPMYCIDLKQELDNKADRLRLPNTELSKEQMIETIKGTANYPKQTNEHNALSDARWNYELYKFLNTFSIYNSSILLV